MRPGLLGAADPSSIGHRGGSDRLSGASCSDLDGQDQARAQASGLAAGWPV